MTSNSMFLTDLHVELRPGCDDLWILTESLLYVSNVYGLITIPKGFISDFASVPRVPIAYNVWGDRVHRESVLHDYLYRRNAKPELSFSACNSTFLEAMESRDVAWYIRYPMYWAVCTFGSPFYKREEV